MPSTPVENAMSSLEKSASSILSQVEKLRTALHVEVYDKGLIFSIGEEMFDRVDELNDNFDKLGEMINEL